MPPSALGELSDKSISIMVHFRGVQLSGAVRVTWVPEDPHDHPVRALILSPAIYGFHSSLDAAEGIPDISDTSHAFFIPSASVLRRRERRSFRFMIYQADPVGWYFDLRRDPGKAAHQYVRQTAGVVTGRDKGGPVVPVRVRGGVVRVDVARPIVGAIVQVAPTPHSSHRVGINEVGGKSGILPTCTAVPDGFMRVSYYYERGRGPSSLRPCGLSEFTPTGPCKGRPRSTSSRTRGRSTR